MPAKVLEMAPATGAPGPSLRKKKIDRFGELDRRLSLVAADQEEYDLLKKEFQEWHKDDDGAKPCVEIGNIYQANLSARRKERTVIDKKKAWAALRKSFGGVDALLAALDLPLGLIDKHVPESERKAFLHQEHSGYRTVDVVALHPVEDRKAA